MQRDEVVHMIIRILNRIAADKGSPTPAITDDVLLLGEDLGIDSLDLAALVVELQTATGRDPFKDGFIEFRTVLELSTLFAE